MLISAPRTRHQKESSGGFLSGLLGAAGSVVTGVLSVKDSLIDTATSGVSAGISGILQGASGLGTLAKTKPKAGKKKSKPKLQERPTQTKPRVTESVLRAKTNPPPNQARSPVQQLPVLSTTTRTTKRTTKRTTRRSSQVTKRKLVSKKPVASRGTTHPTAKPVRSPRTTTKPSPRKAHQPAAENIQDPTPTNRHLPGWVSESVGQVSEVLTGLTEQSLENALAPLCPSRLPRLRRRRRLRVNPAGSGRHH